MDFTAVMMEAKEKGVGIVFIPNDAEFDRWYWPETGEDKPECMRSSVFSHMLNIIGDTTPHGFIIHSFHNPALSLDQLGGFRKIQTHAMATGDVVIIGGNVTFTDAFGKTGVISEKNGVPELIITDHGIDPEIVWSEIDRHEAAISHLRQFVSPAKNPNSSRQIQAGIYRDGFPKFGQE